MVNTLDDYNSSEPTYGVDLPLTQLLAAMTLRVPRPDNALGLYDGPEKNPPVGVDGVIENLKLVRTL